ncbi:MAG: hypothetical protein R2764_15275 [Bacteroidales bacterium]
MNTVLNKQNLISLSQPFNCSPWNYSGIEKVKEIPNERIVDWILVDVRDAATAESAKPGSVVSRQAAFLLDDGSIVDLDGESKIYFYNSIEEQLYVVISHRNHLAIMSSQPINEGEDSWIYDYTTNGNKVYGGELGYKKIDENTWAMVAGNGYRDSEISISDKVYIWTPEVLETKVICQEILVWMEKSTTLTKMKFFRITLGKRARYQ